MSHPERPQPNDPFGFTEKDRLYDRITGERLEAILKEAQTAVHKVELSSNNYGEFLFVTLSRPANVNRVALTFWGLGYHEYRERWLTDEWNWYQTSLRPAETEPLEKSEVLRLLQERHEEIAAYSRDASQTRRGALFELLADLTDEDGAWAELDDLDHLFGDAYWEE